MKAPQSVWRHEVRRLTAEGHRLAHLGENAEALACFVEALYLVPEPRGEHEAIGPIVHGLRQVLEARGDLGDGLEVQLALRPGLGSMLARFTGRGEWAG